MTPIPDTLYTLLNPSPFLIKLPSAVQYCGRYCCCVDTRSKIWKWNEQIPTIAYTVIMEIWLIIPPLFSGPIITTLQQNPRMRSFGLSFAFSYVARPSHMLTYWIWIRQWAQWGRQKRNVVAVERKRLGSGSLSRAWNESYFQKSLSHFNLCCYSLSFLSYPLGGFLHQHFHFHLFISGQTLLLWFLETLYILLCQADEACQSCMYSIHLAFSPDVSGECMIEH